MTIELQLTKAEERLLWDYCVRLDYTVRSVVQKLIQRELLDETLLKEKAYKAKHVKVRETKVDKENNELQDKNRID